jgi:A/G-specific adenine glycosylase
MPSKSMSDQMHNSERRRLQDRLLRWFDEHKRDLPWRRDRDPYRIWLSEIMLQQTRVAAVQAHYVKFLERFPTVQKLAAAREASVLAAWSGLGYYRRARMMHKAAKIVVREFAGRFPRTSTKLQELPGIGRYTAAAVASIAFGEPVAVVDGNVERVLQRLCGERLEQSILWRRAQEYLDQKRPGDFNQAMMELGATVCLPREPKCLLCPIGEWCSTRGEVPATRRGVRQKKREICYAVDYRNGSVFLVQRPSSAHLMPGMWELPEIAATEVNGDVCITLRHSITTTNYQVRVVRQVARTKEGRWVRKTQLTKQPLTGLARKILRAANII